MALIIKRSNIHITEFLLLSCRLRKRVYRFALLWSGFPNDGFQMLDSPS